MNGMDSKRLIDYFKNKNGKYLKLDNGKKVKLLEVIDCQDTLRLTFRYSSKDLVIPFKLSEDYITIYIPEGLEEGHFVSSIVVFDNLQRIGYAIEKILTNWTERDEFIESKDEVIELDWEE